MLRRGQIANLEGLNYRRGGQIRLVCQGTGVHRPGWDDVTFISATIVGVEGYVPNLRTDQESCRPFVFVRIILDVSASINT